MFKQKGASVHTGQIPVLTEVVGGAPLDIPVLTEEVIVAAQEPSATAAVPATLPVQQTAITLSAQQCQHFSTALVARIEAWLLQQYDEYTDADWQELQHVLPDLIHAQFMESADAQPAADSKGLGIIPLSFDKPVLSRAEGLRTGLSAPPTEQ